MYSQSQVKWDYFSARGMKQAGRPWTTAVPTSPHPTPNPSPTPLYTMTCVYPSTLAAWHLWPSSNPWGGWIWSRVKIADAQGTSAHDWGLAVTMLYKWLNACRHMHACTHTFRLCSHLCFLSPYALTIKLENSVAHEWIQKYPLARRNLLNHEKHTQVFLSERLVSCTET